jgi:hypothetical protein
MKNLTSDSTALQIDSFPSNVSTNFIADTECDSEKMSQRLAVEETESSPRKMHPELEGFRETLVINPYECDFYGQPRLLSQWEIIAYALARPVLIGVVLGFGLAISLHFFPPTSSAQEKKILGTLVEVTLPIDEP